MNRRRATVVGVAVAVAAVTVAVQWPALSNGFTHWDDNLYLDEVVRLKGLSWPTVEWAFTTTKHFYYHPLTWLSHAFDYQLWGLNPARHHGVSVAFHGLNAALAVTFVWMLLGRIAMLSDSERLACAAGIGLVFGIHPLQVEAVAWVAERKTLLCASFMMASACAYLRATSPVRSRAWFAVTIVLFVAALLAKPMAVTLPLVLLILDFYPLNRPATLDWRQLVMEKIPLFVLSAASAVITVVAQSRVGALGVFEHLSVWQRCLVAVRGVAFYVWKLFWPVWLSPFYPLGGKITIVEKEFLVPVVAIAVSSALCVAMRKRTPALLAAWLAFLALLLPNLGLVQAGGQAVADRFMYVAMLPLLLLIAGACVWFWRRARAVSRAALIGLFGCELVFLAYRTREQIPVWHDDVTLWQAVLQHFPNSTTEYRFVTQGLIDQRRFEEALPYAQEAVARMPEDPLARSELALVDREVAGARAEQRRFGEALPFANEAVKLNPGDLSARSLLGYVLLKTGDFTAAARQCREALHLDSNLPAARYNLACACSRLGQFEEALGTLRELLAIHPQYADAASRDPELAGLRDSPEYAERFRALVQPLSTK